MNIAHTMAPGRGDTNLLLHRLAQDLIARGLRVAGTVQVDTERADAGPCDMDVSVLPAGPVIRISQTLGTGARGCRLDPNALERAVALVERSLDTRPDLVILNKFGKHEAEGRGFRPVIAAALALEIPVLVGLNALNAPAFEAFSGGMSKELPPDLVALETWIHDKASSTGVMGSGHVQADPGSSHAAPSIPSP